MVGLKLFASGLVAVVTGSSGDLTLVAPSVTGHYPLIAWDTSQVQSQKIDCPSPSSQVILPPGIEACALEGVEMELDGLKTTGGGILKQDLGGSTAGLCEKATLGQFPNDRREREGFSWTTEFQCLAKVTTLGLGRISSTYYSGSDSAKVAGRLRLRNVGGLAETFTLADDPKTGLIYSMAFFPGAPPAGGAINHAVADSIRVNLLQLKNGQSLRLVGKPLDAAGKRVEVILTPRADVGSIDILLGNLGSGDCAVLQGAPLLHFAHFCEMSDPALSSQSCPYPHPDSAMVGGAINPAPPTVLGVDVKQPMCTQGTIHRPFCLMAAFEEPSAN